MHRYSRYATVSVTELFVRSTLPHLDKAEPLETRYHFARPQDRQRTHAESLRDADRFGPDELRFARWLAVFEEHSDDFLEVRAQLLFGLTLTMRSREARDVPDEEPSVGVALYDYGEFAHTQLYRELCARGSNCSSARRYPRRSWRFAGSGRAE